jgi:PAS domain S-box-containing protein
LENKGSDNIFSNKQFIEIIDNLDIIYFRGELRGKLLFHNKGLNRILGLDTSIDLTGSPSSQFFSDSKLLEKYYNELEKKGFVKDFIVNIKNPKGEVLYIQLNSHLIKGNRQNRKIVEGTAVDITEKYILEQNLKETERRFNLIANNSNDLIAILNKNFEHIYINENAYSSVLGYKKEEVLGKRPRDFSHPDDLKRVSKSLRKGLLKGEVSEKYRTKHKNGDYIWIELKGKFLYENGQINGVILISRDITKHQNTEQKLRESEEKYRSMVEDAQEGVWALDENENTILINPRICEMLGYTKNEMIGKNLHLFLPESMETLIQGNRSRRETGVKETYELQLVKKDGSIIYTEVRAAPIMDDAQNYKGSFAYITDITEGKKAILKIQESENKYRTLFESSTDGIYSANMDGQFIEVNKAFLEMIGYSRKELLEMNNRQITPPKWYETEDNNLLTQLSIGESKVYEKEIIHKNGNILPVSIRFWILQDEQGDPFRIWAIVRDIAESKKMEYKLKEINRLKSEFLRRASHELKTPLVSIKGFSELILSKYSEDLNPGIILNLEEINKGCERLQIIINNLLQTSKLESTEFKPKLEREDLSFLINYCAEELHALVAKREHSINIDIPETLITKFEKEEIHDVISNLLLNAIKYTPPKGWIEIRAEVLEDFIVVSIGDNGIGFTEEEKSNIFQQFGKIERYGQGLDLGIDGSGLGLYISKKIIESHGGKIWMESEGRNKGSTFYFSLPLIKD